jgi:enoyl-CoA hydratase/carnithine racemase
VESLAYSSLQGGPEFAGWLAARARPAPRPADPGAAVVVERRGDRLDLTLNRPRVRNAYSSAMRDQLCEALSVACADRSIGQVHLHGEGPDFCSGGDLDEFGALADPATAHLVRTARSAARLLGMVGDRSVAHLQGACVGAGAELPALAGRVVAAADTRLQLPEVTMGLIPGAGGTASLPRRIGRHRTAWMALTGQFVDVVTAQQWGLVDEVAGA